MSFLLDAGAGAAAPPSTWLTTGGAVGVLAFFVLAFIKGWIVSKPSHDRVLAERNRLLELALTSTAAAKAAVDIAHQDRDAIRRIAGTSD
jgi:hypothetical protein